MSAGQDWARWRGSPSPVPLQSPSHPTHQRWVSHGPARSRNPPRSPAGRDSTVRRRGLESFLGPLLMGSPHSRGPWHSAKGLFCPSVSNRKCGPSGRVLTLSRSPCTPARSPAAGQQPYSVAAVALRARLLRYKSVFPGASGPVRSIWGLDFQRSPYSPGHVPGP